MTGPEHYTEAERLLAVAFETKTPSAGAVITAAAQVHATLALVAATTQNHPEGGWAVTR